MAKDDLSTGFVRGLVISDRSFRIAVVVRVLAVSTAVFVALLLSAEHAAAQIRAEVSNSVTVVQTSLPHPAGNDDAIVVGFLGGFVHRNDQHHPEIQLIQQLRQEYSTDNYFGLFENSKIDEAHSEILRHLRLRDAKSPAERNQQVPRIILFGHSWGASAVVRLARKLDRDGIPVALTIQVDSVAKPFSDDRVIPPNVMQAVNFYQTHGLIHGQFGIIAADPSRTRIIGNFRVDYKTEPAPCRNFSWYSRVFTKAHIEIECDPELWLQVKTLISGYLPNTSMAQSEVEPDDARIQVPISEDKSSRSAHWKIFNR